MRWFFILVNGGALKGLIKSLRIVLIATMVACGALPVAWADDSCRNILIEEFEVGDVCDGVDCNGYNRVRNTSSAYTPVEPNTKYRMQSDSSWHVWAYDENKEYLASIAHGKVALITTPENARYIRVSSYPDYGTTYRNNLIISKGDDVVEYHPYNSLCATCDGMVVVENGESRCVPLIKLATKEYDTVAFRPVNTLLDTVVTTINNLVANTVAQATTIKEIATTRQTRPEVGCPAGKQCLLIKNPDGAAQWFEIFDPFHDFFDPIKVTATVSGTEYTYYGNSTGAFGQHTSDSNTLLRWQGNPNWREKYVDGSRSVYTRQWTAATPARTVGGMYETLQDGDETNAGTWAVEYDGTELTGMKAGVVYGIAKCTPQNASRNYTSTTPSSTYEELTEQQQTLWNSVPAKTWAAASEAGETHTDTWSNALASDAATNFKNCWCKMTALGAPGENGASYGVVYPVNGASWVFARTIGSAARCASDCAHNCAYYVRNSAGFRAAVFNF